MAEPDIKGWCPGALRPMLSGDGWVVRVRPPGGRLAPKQASGIARLALAFGNGVISLSSRANIHLRGVTEHGYGPLIEGLNALSLIDENVDAEEHRNIVLTPFWSPGMTAGRGWIALALVVFASWRPWRVVWGALLFGGATMLELHLQAWGVGVPSQLLSALPYLATIAALIILSVLDRRGSSAPAALGTAFVADR